MAAQGSGEILCIAAANQANVHVIEHDIDR